MKRNFIGIILLFVLANATGQSTNPFNLGRKSIQTDLEDTLSVNQKTQQNIQSQYESRNTVDTVATKSASQPLEKGSNPFNLRSKKIENIDATDSPEVQKLDSSLLEKKDSSQVENSQYPIINEEGKLASLFQKLPNRVKSPLLIFWSSVISLILLAFVLTNRRGILRNMMKGLGNRFYLSTFKKEEDGGWSSGISILYLIFIINITAFIHLTLKINGWLTHHKYLYLWVLFSVIIILLARHIVIGVMKRISKYRSEFDLYYFMIVCVNILVGLSLIPINLLIAYGPQVLEMKILFFGLGLLGITLIIKWLKGIYSSLSIIVNTSYHFLLYLCTAEILPLLVGIRLFYNLI